MELRESSDGRQTRLVRADHRVGRWYWRSSQVDRASYNDISESLRVHLIVQTSFLDAILRTRP